MPARTRYRQLFEQAAELHDDCHFARRKILADGDRGDERERDEHVCLDIECGDESDDRFKDDGQTAQRDGNPRRIDRECARERQAQHERHGGDD